MNTRSELKYLLLIIVVFIAACIETDIFLPALPDMMTWFSVSEGAIQSLLTWNFVGICVSGPFYGPLSDAYGRKKPLLFALAFFLGGSVLTLVAQNFGLMLFGRVLQGIGSGGCFTLGTAIIFDAFQKERAIKALNRLNTIVPLIMAGAPLLGGFLNNTFGFRSNFTAIGLFALLSLVISIFFFEETLPQEKRAPFQMKKALADYKEALCCVPFWQLTIATCITFAGYIAFLSGTSVLFVVEFKMSKAIFPLVQAAVLGGWVAGSLLLSRAIAKWGIPKIKKAGMHLSVLGGLFLLIITVVAPRDAYLLTVGMVIFAFGANWLIGLYFPEAMEILPHIKGVTASLMTSFRLLIAALVLGLSSYLYNSTIYPLTALVVATIVVILPMIILYEKRKAKMAATSS